MKLWLKATVSAFVLALVLWLVPWKDVLASCRQLPPRVWLGVLSGFLAGHIVGAMKWSYLLRTLGSPLPWSRGLRCYAAGLFANLCLPSIVGGDVVRATAAARSSGKVEAVILGSIADRALDTLALLTVMGLGSLAAGSVVGKAYIRIGLMTIAAGVICCLLVLFLLARRPLRAWPARLRRKVAKVLIAVRKLARAPKAAFISLSLALLMQSWFILLSAWIGISLGVSTPLAVWFVVWPIAKLAGLLPISLGGLGVRDATLGALIAGFGVPAAQGLATSFVWQSILITGGLLSGLFWWIGPNRVRWVLLAPGEKQRTHRMDSHDE